MKQDPTLPCPFCKGKSIPNVDEIPVGELRAFEEELDHVANYAAWRRKSLEDASEENVKECRRLMRVIYSHIKFPWAKFKDRISDE